MLVPFHPSVTHALAAVPAVLPTVHHSPNVSLSGVIYHILIALTLNTDKTVLLVSQPDSQSLLVERVAVPLLLLLLLHGREQRGGQGVIQSTGMPEECQITVHRAGTVASC